LRDHLIAVAELAAVRGAKFRADKAAVLAGLLHDLANIAMAFSAG
jgi:HD superfamily phosphodiesterase